MDVFAICVCLFHSVCSVSCSCWERADLLALLYVMFSCVLSLSHVLGQVWRLIVSIPGLCLLPYCFQRDYRHDSSTNSVISYQFRMILFTLAHFCTEMFP